MTDADAFRAISAMMVDGNRPSGICNGLYRLRYAGSISIEQEIRLEHRIADHVEAFHDGVWAWPMGSHYAERILACLFLACEADDDHR